MSHGKLRNDTNCLNCGHTVEERFCTHCGQENIETRQAFYFLITHFIEDFTHYDGQFWKTIKYLLFKPGKLTKDYLSGKRQRYVAPVKLYIFMSFITFLWLAFFLPVQLNFETKSQNKNLTSTELIKTADLHAAKFKIDSIKSSKEQLSPEELVYLEKTSTVLNESSKVQKIGKKMDMSKKLEDDFEVNGYTNKKSFDSAAAANPSTFDYINTPFAHKFFELKEKGISKGEILKSLIENSFHSLPKALFIYLPIFAFILWIFHNKKKWWYFDHGIFTLHYFSFLLLGIFFFSILSEISSKINNGFASLIINLTILIITIYSVVYFFVAHRRVYESRKSITLIKGFLLFFINTFLIFFLLLGLILLSFMMIH